MPCTENAASSTPTIAANAPPLNLWGRIARGRLIIPGYDKVLIAPLLAIGAFVTAMLVRLWFDELEFIALPDGVITAWWLLYGMGPSLDSWRLTGNYRITKGYMPNL